MSWLMLSDIARMTEGTLYGEDVAVGRVETDSRKVGADALFIALKGERFDAHEFVAGLEGKAPGVMVSRLLECNIPQVVVEDTRQALAALAREWRKQFTGPLIGLTGSNGKTTLKEMVSAILSQQGNVLSTHGNLNNDIGMPLTLLRLRKEHDYAVIELGANHFGEIELLTKISSPDVAIINNAGPAHLEGFGDIPGVARAKGEIFLGLRDSGTAVINADDPYADYWTGLNVGRIMLRFGMQADIADVRGEYAGNGVLTIHVGGEQETVKLALPGRHNAMNALAATAVVTALNIQLPMVKQGLESLQPVKGRLAGLQGKHGAWLIDDTYNANPASARAALEVLAEASGQRMLVLGDMGELGEDAAELHAAIGVKARESGIEQLFCLGRLSREACDEFGAAGQAYEDFDKLMEAINGNLTADMTILVKGSRSMQMERVINALAASEETD